MFHLKSNPNDCEIFFRDVPLFPITLRFPWPLLEFRRRWNSSASTLVDTATQRNATRRNAFSMNTIRLLNVFDYCGAARRSNRTHWIDWSDTTCCQTGLTTGCIVYTNIQPVVKPVVKLSNPFDNRFDNRLNEQWLYRVNKHPTRCQTGLTSGLTTGWMFVYTIQPVVKPVGQPVVSCKRVSVYWTRRVAACGAASGVHEHLEMNISVLYIADYAVGCCFTYVHYHSV